MFVESIIHNDIISLGSAYHKMGCIDFHQDGVPDRKEKKSKILHTLLKNLFNILFITFFNYIFFLGDVISMSLLKL